MKSTEDSVVSKVNMTFTQGAQSYMGNKQHTNDHINKYVTCQSWAYACFPSELFPTLFLSAAFSLPLASQEVQPTEDTVRIRGLEQGKIHHYVSSGQPWVSSNSHYVALPPKFQDPPCI